MSQLIQVKVCIRCKMEKQHTQFLHQYSPVCFICINTARYIHACYNCNYVYEFKTTRPPSHHYCMDCKTKYNNRQMCLLERCTICKKGVLNRLQRKYCNKICREISRNIKAKEWFKTEEGKKSKKLSKLKRRHGLRTGGTLDINAWTEKLAKLGGQCQWCGTKQNITIDHIIPISKGGTNHIDNLQPLCHSCNSSKGNRILEAKKQ